MLGYFARPEGVVEAPAVGADSCAAGSAPAAEGIPGEVAGYVRPAGFCVAAAGHAEQAELHMLAAAGHRDRTTGQVASVAGLRVRTSRLTPDGTTLVADLAGHRVYRFALAVRLSPCIVGLSPSNVPGAPFAELTSLSLFSRARFTDCWAVRVVSSSPFAVPTPAGRILWTDTSLSSHHRLPHYTDPSFPSHTFTSARHAMSGTLFALWLRA